MSRRVVIPGGSGFLGRALSQQLVARGDDVVVLTRGRNEHRVGVTYVHWDAESLGPWVDCVSGADAVVHLSGKRVDCRPTRSNINELITSRVRPVQLVAAAVAATATPPPVWVQSSTLAIYGEGGDDLLDEAAPVSGVGPQQMVQVALAWEAAFAAATVDIPRAVLLRIGVTFGGDDDPATKRLAALVRLGLGGQVGHGRQWLSWIALDDVLNALLRAIDEPSMRGLYHLTSPNPVRNHEAMAAFRASLGRRVGLPAPAWLTRLGAPVLGSDPELALTGRRGYPRRLLDEGFVFTENDFETAVGRALAVPSKETADVAGH